MNIRTLLSKITGYRYNFKIKIVYTPDKMNGEKIASQIFTINLEDKASIDNERVIKKLVASDLVKKLPIDWHTSGHIEITEAYYLGWFKPLKRNPRQYRKSKVMK